MLQSNPFSLLVIISSAAIKIDAVPAISLDDRTAG
jgi:hypothetical protein